MSTLILKYPLPNNVEIRPKNVEPIDVPLQYSVYK